MALFARLGHFMYRRRWYVVGIWLVVLVTSLGLAYHVGDVLGPGDFVIGGSDSAAATALLDTKFHQNTDKVTLVLVRSTSSSVADPGFERAVSSIVRRLRADRALKIAYLDNPLVSHNSQLIARDRHGLGIELSSNLKEADIEPKIDHVRSLVRTPGYSTWVIGTPALNHEYTVQAQEDIKRGDTIFVPILLLVLLLVFGTVVAAMLPLLLAAFAVALSLAFVFIFGHVLNTSVYVENVVMFLGLGISIDYSLFIVYRFREELAAADGDVEGAIVRTMQTTGRAVFFSGITVAIGLSSLILTGVSFLASMGLGGVLVPVSGLLVSMTLLPAALGLFGAKVNRLRVIPTRFLRVGENGAWHRLATAVMARPLVSGGAVLVVMLALSFPLTKLALSYGGLANAPKGLQAIQGYIYMKEHFPTTSDPTQVLVQHLGPGTLLAPREVTGIRALENTLRKNPEAVRVVGPAEFIATSGVPSPSQIAQLKGRYLSSDLRTALIDVTPRHEVGTKPSERLVRQFRQAVAPLATGALKGNAIHVGGAAANYIDWDDAIYGKFPLVIAIVLILTYVFLFFAFRSVFLPLKAVLLNLLSVGAAYGALQLVFQRGIGSSVLSFVPEDGVAPWVPVFLFAFLFGLSMDYEVFLISRMRERWLQTGYNRESVAFGLEKTGRLITSAAGIMIIAFLAFLIGHQIQLKEFGFGLLASIALDASLIRIVLVPSIMEIMGRWNWWVPGFLAGFAQGGVAVERTPAEPEKEPAQAG